MEKIINFLKKIKTFEKILTLWIADEMSMTLVSVTNDFEVV